MQLPLPLPDMSLAKLGIGDGLCVVTAIIAPIFTRFPPALDVAFNYNKWDQSIRNFVFLGEVCHVAT